MAHVIRDRKKLLNRISRIRGQLEGIAHAVEAGDDCGDTLHNIAACRGALDSLMVEVIEGHIRFHVVDPDRRPTTAQALAAQELIEVIRTYLK